MIALLESHRALFYLKPFSFVFLLLTHTHTRQGFLDIYIYIYMLVTIVEDNQKAPFLVVTTPRCRKEH